MLLQKYITMRNLCSIFLIAALLWATPVSVFANAGSPVEEVIVTGSHIRHDVAARGSPRAVIGSSQLETQGINAVSDIVKYLPYNTGSEFNADVFTQNLSAGTSHFNLRGLGLNTTLVLINGRRQTVSGGIADDGSAFVDLNALMPLIMVDRVEVLKDGAAAVYGSDAVAGVVNVIPHIAFQGFEAQAEAATTTRSSQEDFTLSALYGVASDRFDLTAAVSYLHRSWLPSPERTFTQGKGFSSFGQPGAFILLEESPVFPELPFGIDNPQPILDPNCGKVGGLPAEKSPGSRLGLCRFDFAPYYHLVPRERRLNVYSTSRLDAGDDIELFAEAGYARNSLTRGTSPSFPILNLPIVPPINPGNVFRVPALFLGRPFGANAPPNLVDHYSETSRFVAGGRGALVGDWTWEASAVYSSNNFDVGITNALTNRFDSALNGRGGPTGNLFFNPFGSAALAQPGDDTYNSTAVIDDFLSLATYDYETTLAAAEVVVRGDLIELPAGDLRAAVGVQYRFEDIRGDFDEESNRENYLFLIGGPDFSGKRNVWALFAEVSIPVNNKLDLQLALRHERYGSGERSSNPKISASWRPENWLSLRASFGTAFRAPSVFQSFSSQTVLEDIYDPITRSLVFRGVRTTGTQDLASERADVYNFGTTLTLIEGLAVLVDYWRIGHSGIIVKENAQRIIDANPFDPRINREAGEILRINTNYINASAVETDGLDVSLNYNFPDMHLGDFALVTEATYINKYAIQETIEASKRDVAGSRNFRTFARSLPHWRTNIGMSWTKNRNSVNAFVHYIAGYHDDQNNLPVANHITVDMQYSFQLSSLQPQSEYSSRLVLGVINMFDRDPPDVITNVGYDSKVHDPRGRLVYVRLRFGF